MTLSLVVSRSKESKAAAVFGERASAVNDFRYESSLCETNDG